MYLCLNSNISETKDVVYIVNTLKVCEAATYSKHLYFNTQDSSEILVLSSNRRSYENKIPASLTLRTNYVEEGDDA